MGTQPCPCGYHNHPEKDCVCGPGVVKKYLNKISGPLMDRIDLHVEVTPVSVDQITSLARAKENSQDISERVIKARLIQAERFKDQTNMYCNAQMSSNMVKDVCQLDEPSLKMLKMAMEKLQLSARAYDRILKVARTGADLANSENITSEHIAEAIQYRSLDRDGWAE